MAHPLDVAAELRARRRPFVLATVVWRRAPTSGQPGGHALIEPDGTVHGWIGGACAEPTVLREAREVLASGRSRLLHLGPADEIDAPLRADVVQVPIACASEGSLEIFMEPVLPSPSVVVAGRSPAALTLVELLQVLDWDVSAVERVDAAAVDAGTAVVIASQGHDDEALLEAALATPAAWIGLVASRRRGETLLGYLRDAGHDEAQVARIRVPAGLDLGHVLPEEIGVAILAELVACRARGELGGPTVAGGGVELPLVAPVTAVDPVCGMTVEVAGAAYTSDHDGQTVVFCCPACKRLFDADPAAYALSS